MLTSIRLVVVVIIGFISSSSFAASMSQREVAEMLSQLRSQPLEKRIDHISTQFMGHPYVPDGFGEGARESALYDQDKRYRFDGFDCTTYVETVVALALSDDFAEFERHIDRIRYRDGHPSYVARNHFPSLDWIPNNVAAGYFDDISRTIAGPHALIAEALIDKRAWYASKTLQDLRVNVPPLTRKQALARLRQWHAEGDAFQRETANLDYVPLTAIFPSNQILLDKIPSGAVINVVRPGWNIRNKHKKHITQMNVSHQGFAIRKEDGVLYLRHASSSSKNYHVTEQPLADYLADYVGHATVKGISVLQVRSHR